MTKYALRWDWPLNTMWLSKSDPFSKKFRPKPQAVPRGWAQRAFIIEHENLALTDQVMW
jgi:hypothetical protein